MLRYVILVSFLLLNACIKHQEKDHLQRVTLKLAKPVEIKVHKEGNSNSHFFVSANVKYIEPFLQAEGKWVILDPEEKIVYESTQTFKDKSHDLKFQSDEISLPEADYNYKIVFIFSGQTATEEVHKTEIFYSLNQQEIDDALKELRERAKRQ